MRKTPDLCVVSIAHTQLLLPQDAALRLMQALRQAVQVEFDFENLDRMKYRVGSKPRVELMTVEPGQLTHTDGGPALLGSPKRAQRSPKV